MGVSRNPYYGGALRQGIIEIRFQRCLIDECATICNLYLPRRTSITPLLGFYMRTSCSEEKPGRTRRRIDLSSTAFRESLTVFSSRIYLYITRIRIGLCNFRAHVRYQKRQCLGLHSFRPLETRPSVICIYIYINLLRSTEPKAEKLSDRIFSFYSTCHIFFFF